MRPICPAASPVWAGTLDGDSIVCGVLELSNDGAHVRGFQERGQVSPVISGRKDAGTVQLFCCGDGREGSQACFTRCELWRAQRDAEMANRRGPDALRDRAHREYVPQDSLAALTGVS